MLRTGDQPGITVSLRAQKNGQYMYRRNVCSDLARTASSKMMTSPATPFNDCNKHKTTVRKIEGFEKHVFCVGKKLRRRRERQSFLPHLTASALASRSKTALCHVVTIL